MQASRWRRMRYWMAVGIVALAMLVSAAAARADTVTLSPTADAFVRAQTPTVNFGSADYLDSQGGYSSYACGADGDEITGAAYAYLKFDLSQIPADAVISSAEVQLTSRSGFAWDGDPEQHLRLVNDDAWTEQGITYANAPLVAPDYLASKFIFYGFPVCGDPKGDPQPQSFTGDALTQAVASKRAGDGTLSLQV